MPPSNERPSNDCHRSVSAAAGALAKTVGPIGVASAALFFFGWVRTRALFGYFGVDLGLLGFSPTDYILRSAEIVFGPVVVIATVILLAYGVHWLVSHKLPGYRWVLTLRVSLEWGLLVLGASGVLVAAAGLLGYSVAPSVASVSLGLGALALYGGLRLREDRSGVEGAVDAPTVRARGIYPLLIATTVSIFWAISVFATQAGIDLAEGFARGTAARPDVVVYSRTRLALEGEAPPTAAPLPPDRGYSYVTRNLQLLAYSNRTWILISKRWDRSTPTVVLRDDDNVRVEIRPWD